MKVERYILLDDDGYVIGICETPWADGLSERVTISGDVDMEKMDCYRYTSGEFVLDEEKETRRKRENLGIRLRNRRDELLRDSDYMGMPDYPITEEERAEWRVYRQALRDLPEQPGWPEGVEWPEPPT